MNLKLFEPEETGSAARFSACGSYRYTLHRQWGDGLTALEQRVCWVMLNPSTADAERNDPTVAKCIRYSQRWGYGSLWVVNLFAYRATDPRAMKAHPQPVGEPGGGWGGDPERQRNDWEILTCARRSLRVVVAWGVDGAHLGRGEHVRQLLEGAGIPLWCLGATQDGYPRHPLYVPMAQPLEPWPCRE